MHIRDSLRIYIYIIYYIDDVECDLVSQVACQGLLAEACSLHLWPKQGRRGLVNWAVVMVDGSQWHSWRAARQGPELCKRAKRSLFRLEMCPSPVSQANAVEPIHDDTYEMRELSLTDWLKDVFFNAFQDI